MTGPVGDAAGGCRNGQSVRVAVVDDDAIVRSGVVALLRMDADLDVVAEGDDGHAALDLVRRHRLDVVLLDIRMPRMDGLRALERLRAEQPAVPVAMLTTFADEAYIAEAVELGALGFLLKSDAPRDLIAAVKGIAGGGAAFSPRVARWLVRTEATVRIRRDRTARDIVDRLSTRQRELLAVLGTGASNAEIARRMRLSDGTVKQYLREIFDRIEVTNRVQAAILAHEAGLDQEARGS
ncbi:response regulator transcription factor [Cellulomonas sp.]|uniref:response regulator transcription factor n=1 Tax=Cellulomonas sp. TaxID=40001 RepID=UPI0028115B48|nr:response regulator transcription factor [Cellulomonas sp.]